MSFSIREPRTRVSISVRIKFVYGFRNGVRGLILAQAVADRSVRATGS